MIQKRTGVDVGWHNSNVYPDDQEGRVGKEGIDKTFSLEKMIRIASNMTDRPNVIVKGGVNAKWYLKRCPKDMIDYKIDQQKWRDCKNIIMYIIEWDYN